MNKSFLTILLVILISCSPDERMEKIIGDWKIINAVRLDINKPLPDQKVTISFNSDRTYTFKTDLSEIDGSGKWEFENNDLILISGTDTTNYELEKLTETEMVWKLNSAESGLKFELEKE